MDVTAEATEKVLNALDAWAGDLPADQRTALQHILELATLGAEVAVAQRPQEVSGFGPLVTTSCLFNRPACDGDCILGDLLGRIRTEIKDHFAGTKLSALPQLNGVRDD